MYKRVLKPILFQLDPEWVHEKFITLGETLGQFKTTRALAGALWNYRGPDKSRTVDGLTYRLPFVLAAGFDYNARLTRILPALGFGGVEVGSITARPCAGNPRPRLIRLPRSGSIIVNKGLRNDGVEIIIKRLKAKLRPASLVIGVSIARTNDERSADLAAGINDYCYSYRRLNEENIGDYYTLNISCPNAFGGETFTNPDRLERLLQAIRRIPGGKPLYLKLPINLPWPELKNLIEAGLKYKINGVIIGNLNKNYSDLKDGRETPTKPCGGLSGEPCRALSTNLIQQATNEFGSRLTIIGCGGVMSVAGAREKFAAGAQLIQLITGLIYEGPGLIKKLAKSI